MVPSGGQMRLVTLPPIAQNSAMNPASDVYGNAYVLEVTIIDRGKRELTKTVQVTPECGQPENLAECLCICRAGYITGQACSDGGD